MAKVAAWLVELAVVADEEAPVAAEFAGLYGYDGDGEFLVEEFGTAKFKSFGPFGIVDINGC